MYVSFDESGAARYKNPHFHCWDILNRNHESCMDYGTAQDKEKKRYAV